MQQDMPRSETKEKEYYMKKKNVFKKKFADFKQNSERFKVKLTTS